MVKLTFYGGVNEIGGNKILLEDKEPKSSLALDSLLLSAHIILPSDDHFRFNLMLKIR
jgi:hypothetical protein